MECKHREVSDKRVCGNTLNERIKAVTSILKGKASDVTIVFVKEKYVDTIRSPENKCRP